MLRSRLFLTAALLVLATGYDAAACGDKFLVSGRGTRYQRPKSSRAASILIYASPAAPAGGSPLESMLRREGHRATVAATTAQLGALMAGGRFDVILVAADVLDAVTALVGRVPEAPVVVAMPSPVKETSLLRAVDKAVAQRDKSTRRSSSKG